MRIENIALLLTDATIGETSVYGWNCYPNAVVTDYTSEFGEVSVTQNVKNGMIYEINSITKTPIPKAYRWIDPDFKSVIEQESRERGVDHSIAFDGLTYIDLEVEDDILEKTHAIINGLEFDERIMINLDIDDDLFLHVARMAHKEDITINEMFTKILTEIIERSKEIAKANDETISD